MEKVHPIVTVTFLYYAREVYCTILTALGSIATQQANLAENNRKNVNQFLYYATTHPKSIVTYQASGMILTTHSTDSHP